MPQAWRLKQEKFIFPLPWRLDVQDQGTSRLVPAEASFWTSSPEDLLPRTSRSLCSVCTEREDTLLSPLPLLLRTSVLLHQVPNLMTSFNIKYFLKAVFPNTVTEGVRASMCGFERRQYFIPVFAVSLTSVFIRSPPLPLCVVISRLFP